MHPTTTRQYWIDTMLRIAMPVLSALAEERLKDKKLPKPAMTAKPWELFFHSMPSVSCV